MKLISVDGIDYSGKTTVVTFLEQQYGFFRIPKISDIGGIPKDIKKRMQWYEQTSAPDIIRQVLLADLERRKLAMSKNSVLDRGRITVVADCITKAILKDKISPELSRSMVEQIVQDCHYSPEDGLSFYLRIKSDSLPDLEWRKIKRDGIRFTVYESEYLPCLIQELEMLTTGFLCNTINALNPEKIVLEEIIKILVET